MWTYILVLYTAGLALTAVTLFRARMFKQDHMMNTGAILLWPVYWGVFLVTLIQNRRR